MYKNKPHYIELTRVDLTEINKHKSLDEISIFDFKQSSVTTQEIKETHIIFFKEGNVYKKLKCRY